MHRLFELYEDGTIQTVIQTKEGVQAVGAPPVTNSNEIKYSAVNCEVGGGAAIECTSQGESVVSQLHSTGAYCQFV